MLCHMGMWGEGMIPQGAVWQMGEPQLYDHDLQSSQPSHF